MPNLGPPIPMDPVTFGAQNSCTQFGASAQQGPISYNGALYIPLIQPALGNFSGCNANQFAALDMWKSIDGGLTWLALDHAHAIQAQRFQSVFDGVHSWTFVTIAPTAPTFPMNALQFDLSTETWGALSANGPNTTADPCLIARSSGNVFLVVYTDAITFFLTGVTYTGAWGVPFNIDSNVRALLPNFAAVEAVYGVVDPSDRLHLIFSEVNQHSSPNYLESFLFYQEVSFGGALGSLFQFPVSSGAPPHVLAFSYGQPSIVGNNVVFALVPPISPNTQTGLYVGAGLSSPAWTLFPLIDSAISLSQAANLPVPICNFDGTTLRVMYFAATMDAVYSSGIIRECQTTDFLAWLFQSQTVFDIELDSGAGFQLGGTQSLEYPLYTAAGIAVSAIDPTDSYFQRFFLVSAAGPPTYEVKITLRGVNRRQACDADTPQISEVSTAPSVKRAV